VILAEGMPVELPRHRDRANLHGEEMIRLHPDFAARPAPDTALAWETRGAAPLVMAGEALERVRALEHDCFKLKQSRSDAFFERAIHASG
jgi:hypothetical protein